MHCLENIKYDIIGLSEVRRIGCNIEEYNNSILCYKGETQGLYGVGFLIKKHMKDNIRNFIGLSERVAILKLRIENDDWSIIQVYAPTEDASRKNDDELEIFYATLENALAICDKNVMVIGDFNSKIGHQKEHEDSIMGKFGYGRRSERGDILVQFALENNLSIMNSFFKKKPNKKWTWQSPDGNTKNEVDFILTNKPKLFNDVDVLTSIKFSSDHRMVRAALSLNEPKSSRVTYSNVKKCCTKKEKDITTYLSQLEANKEKLELRENDTVQSYYDRLIRTLEESLSLTRESKGKEKEHKSILSDETKKLIKRRHDVQHTKPKTAEIKRELSKLYKEVNKKIRKDYQTHRMETIERHMRNTGSVKRAYKELNTHKTWIPSLKGNLGVSTDRKSILEIATNYYSSLYSEPRGTKPQQKDVRNETDNFYAINAHFSKEDQIPLFDEIEIIQEIKRLKVEKSPGPDNIVNEAIKIAATKLATPLAHLFNLIISTQLVPSEWTKSNIILLYKKGDPNDVGNYRPVSLLSSIYKLFSACMQKRLSPKIDKNQPIEQAGFRKGFSTIDHIHTIEQIVEKFKEFQKPLYLAFIDYKKAFDSILHDSIWKSLNENEIESEYIETLKYMYARCTSNVKLERKGPDIKIERGVRQGDPISPKIFIAVLESAIRELDWKKYGLYMHGKRINHLRFADDIVLVSENFNDFE